MALETPIYPRNLNVIPSPSVFARTKRSLEEVLKSVLKKLTNELALATGNVIWYWAIRQKMMKYY